jgi:hypothetical protein
MLEHIRGSGIAVGSSKERQNNPLAAYQFPASRFALEEEQAPAMVNKPLDIFACINMHSGR